MNTPENKSSKLATFMKDALEEIQSVGDWYGLGQQLGVPDNDLNYIQEKNAQLQRAKLELFKKWTEINKSYSMNKLASALYQSGYSKLANNIWQKYPSKFL